MSLILLIDDDEDMLAMTGRWLEKSGHQVQKAVSGKDALDYLGGNKPDLVLLDYAMPEMDGPAVLQAIKSNPETAGIPVIFRTGMEDVNNDGPYKPDGVVAKSEGRPSLIKAVESILA